MTDKEMIAYLEDRIIQLEKRLAKYEPSEEEVNDMAKEYLFNDTVGYTVPQTGEYIVTSNYGSSGPVTIPSGVTLSFEVLQNAIDAAARMGR